MCVCPWCRLLKVTGDIFLFTTDGKGLCGQHEVVHVWTTTAVCCGLGKGILRETVVRKRDLQHPDSKKLTHSLQNLSVVLARFTVAAQSHRFHITWLLHGWHLCSIFTLLDYFLADTCVVWFILRSTFWNSLSTEFEQFWLFTVFRKPDLKWTPDKVQVCLKTENVQIFSFARGGAINISATEVPLSSHLSFSGCSHVGKLLRTNERQQKTGYRHNIHFCHTCWPRSWHHTHRMEPKMAVIAMVWSLVFNQTDEKPTEKLLWVFFSL